MCGTASATRARPSQLTKSKRCAPPSLLRRQINSSNQPSQPMKAIRLITLALACWAGWWGGVAFAATNAPSGMVILPGGVFKPLFRSTADFKEVTVKPFALDVVPVTNEDFLQFVRANPRWQRSTVKRLFADESYLKNWAGDLELGTNAPADAPATFVSWFAAKAYAQWKGKRLPTVAEWELIAAAGYTQPDGENDAEFKRALFTWYTSPAEKP